MPLFNGIWLTPLHTIIIQLSVLMQWQQWQRAVSYPPTKPIAGKAALNTYGVGLTKTR